MTEEQYSVEEKVQVLMDALIRGNTIYQKFSERMKEQFLIDGYSVDYWKKKFHLNIQVEHLTPSVCKHLDLELIHLHEEATFHYIVSLAKIKLLGCGQTSAYNDKFHKIVKEYQEKGWRLPGQETLKKMSNIDSEDIESAEAIAEVEKEFWKGILQHLSACRKSIDNATLNISVELKAYGSSLSIDRLVQKASELKRGGDYEDE